MNRVDPTGLVWRKSSRSNGQTNCVEVANTLGAVRDSKNPTGPALNADLAPMLALIRAGHIDR